MMNGYVDNWHWGFSFGHGGFGILFWAIIIVVVVAAAQYLIKGK